MRYRVDPVFWDRLRSAGITQRSLADRTPNCRQWMRKIRTEPQRTVSHQWKRAAVAAFPNAQRAAIAALFIPVPERYRVKAAFWGLLAMRQIKKVDLARAVGMSQQWASLLRRSKTMTITEATVDRICAYLGIEQRSLYFYAADARPRPAPVEPKPEFQSPVPIAS